ncbi:putative ribonuclease H-like domain-containing protein, partial [Tanacetum coccineum]
PQEANGDTGLKKSVDARKSKEKNLSTQQYIVFLLWSSISSSYKSSDETYKNDTADDVTGETPVQKQASENEQAVKNFLDKMMDQEKEASEQSNAIRKDAFDNEDLDTYNSPFADQVMGAEDDFNNMEPSTVVSRIPITRIHSIHPKDQIIGDPKIEAIKLFLAYASFMNFRMYQMDIKSAFLYGTIDKEVYVSQPPGFVDQEFPDKVYKVEKALYGLHQAPRAWYKTLSIYLLDNGFYRGQIDMTLFIKRVKANILLVQVYVDDIIFGYTKKSLYTDFEQIMHKRFQISSFGELTFFLGLQVKQKEDGIFISQDKYVGEILKKFGFSSIRTASTPMETNKALTIDKDGENVDVHLYRSMIGSLMYLTSSRPDIMLSVYACSRFQVQPKVSHLNAVKRIFRYLKGRPNLGLWYPKDSPFILEAFSDSDYAGASLDRKSTTGGETSVPQDLGADEVVHKEGGDSVERAITVVASLDAIQVSDDIIRTQTTAMPNVDIPQGINTGGSPRRQDTIGGAPAQTRSERVLEKPNEPPLSEGHTSGSGEGRMEHQFELTANVPITPYDSPLLGGYTPGSDEDEEDASKQGRSSNKTKPMFKDSNFDVLDAEQITTTGPSHVSTANHISTARPEVSVATPSTPPTTASVFDNKDVIFGSFFSCRDHLKARKTQP